MVNKNACGLEMGGRKLFFHTFTNYRAVQRSGAVSPLSSRIGNSLVIVTTGKKKIKREKKASERRGGHSRQVGLTHLVATLVENEIRFWLRDARDAADLL